MTSIVIGKIYVCESTLGREGTQWLNGVFTGLWIKCFEPLPRLEFEV